MTFETRIKVRFGDVDKAGIAYYPVILHYCHVAFEDYFERGAGMPYPDVVERRRLGFPTASLHCEFKRPFRYGVEARVQVTVAHVGRSSVRFEYRFLDADGADLALASNTAVAVDMDTLRPVPIPADLRAAFERALPG